MAANLQSRGVASLGKLFRGKITSTNRTGSSASLSRYSTPYELWRAVHASAYDKNIEEHAQPSAVPDEIIEAQSDKYWAPHPQTGVFGPDTVNTTSGGAAAAGEGFAPPDSVLEQKAFFRPLEGLEKPEPSFP
ncbi:unnamed protein product [Cuscuta epithymum]|uniref:Late embryogenesis abundant protein At5g17165-like n=1 Tax=Cuscuta epithymum TaxID=186058 RepID=A0AAV0BZ50_9ASTE|nr:unnamed protein product [Cuscuta epithymum]